MKLAPYGAVIFSAEQRGGRIFETNGSIYLPHFYYVQQYLKKISYRTIIVLIPLTLDLKLESTENAIWL